MDQARTLDAPGAADAGFDPGWYLAAYPQAVADIAAGRARDALDHYVKLGRYRGYIPHFGAERPQDPAAARSAFGGLWTDQGNALDLVEGRLALNRITAAEAELLRQFIAQGYVVLKKAIGPLLLWRAARALEAAYEGRIAGQKFCAPALGFEVGDWAPGVKDTPCKALDFHTRSQAVLDAIFAPAISRFLGLIFDRPAMATQSLGFWRGSTQRAHQDTAYVTYTLPTQFAAAWIALEDVRPGTGELFYHVGSHRLGDFLYDGRFKNTSDGLRLNPGWNPRPEEDAHWESILQRSAQEGYEEQRFLARRGDVLIWAADLAHGGSPTDLRSTRRSLVAHYCPAEVAPLYFEGGARQIHRHRSGNSYSTLV